VSDENVEVARAYFTAITRNLDRHWHEPRSYAADFEKGEPDDASRQVFDLMHPDIRWKNALGDVFEGKLACARNADDLLEISQAYSATLGEVTDLGGDHVLVATHVRMMGRSSGAPGVVSIFSLLTVRDGLVVESVEYVNRADALDAVK
jgi:ketosteroid isomerase-like protein